MIKPFRSPSVFLAGTLAGCLLFASCNFTSSGVLNTLATVVDASSAVVGVITAIQPTGNTTAVLQYAQDASTAASAAITEWQSSDSTEQKLAVIASDFAAVAAPQLGGATNTQVAALIQTLSQSLVAILAQVHSGAASAHVATLHHQSLALSPVGHYKLHALKAKADATVVKATLFRAGLITPKFAK